MKWRNIPYANPGDKGWLGLRTASAPTFENVIGPPTNTNSPVVAPFDCSDFNLTTPEGSKLPDEVVAQLITRLTGFKTGSKEHDVLMKRVRRARTDQGKGKHLLAIRKEHGDRRRDEGRSS